MSMRVRILVLSLIAAGLTACAAQTPEPAVAPTAQDEAAATVPPTDAAAPSPLPPSAGPPAEEPPGEAVEAALGVCVAPECDYERAVPGSRRLDADAQTGLDRWCIQASFTVEGARQEVAVVVVLQSGSGAPVWSAGEPADNTSCADVE